MLSHISEELINIYTSYEDDLEEKLILHIKISISNIQFSL